LQPPLSRFLETKQKFKWDMAIFLLKYVLFLEYLSNVTFLITAVEIYG